MTEQDQELKQRACRACGEMYFYPVRHSPATRFHCEACVELPGEVRAVFERFNRRIKTLTSQLDKLEQRCRELESRQPGAGKQPL
jgi:hypothetical protein